MADTVWTNGAGTGNFGTAGNWSNGAPAAGGNAIFDGAYSTASVTLGLDRTGDTAGAGLDLASIVVNANYTGDIAASGNPLILGATNVIHRGSGAIYLKGDGGTSEVGIDNIVIDSPSMSAAVLYAGTNAANVYTRVYVRSGGATLASSFELGSGSTARIAVGGHPLRQAYLTVSAGNAASVATVFANGQLTSTRQLTTIFQKGGLVTYSGASITDLYMFGGRFVYNSDSPTYSLGRVRGFGGTLDLLQTYQQKTISSLERDANFQLLYNPSIHLVNATYWFNGDFIDQNAF